MKDFVILENITSFHFSTTTKNYFFLSPLFRNISLNTINCVRRRSCNEIKSENRGNKAAEKDGLYFILRNSHEYLPVYCDMTSEQGAYTLLVTSASNGWKKNEVKLKNPTRPLLSRDYSILEYADQIKALSGAKRFKYRLEANERRHWGGVWTAPMRYRWAII